MRPHGPGASTLIEIAAIATAARASVGTRNIAAYEGCAVKVLSPWDA
jgi:predicted nucleic acid-binding protein